MFLDNTSLLFSKKNISPLSFVQKHIYIYRCVRMSKSLLFSPLFFGEEERCLSSSPHSDIRTHPLHTCQPMWARVACMCAYDFFVCVHFSFRFEGIFFWNQQCALLRQRRTFLSPRAHTPMHTCERHTATRCNTLQHTVTHGNTLRHTATHCNTLHHTGTTHTHDATHLPKSRYGIVGVVRAVNLYRYN